MSAVSQQCVAIFTRKRKSFLSLEVPANESCEIIPTCNQVIALSSERINFHRLQWQRVCDNVNLNTQRHRHRLTSNEMISFVVLGNLLAV